MTRTSYSIAVLPGDGIGREVMDAALALLRALEPRCGRTFEFGVVEPAFRPDQQFNPRSHAGQSRQRGGPGRAQYETLSFAGGRREVP